MEINRMDIHPHRPMVPIQRIVHPVPVKIRVQHRMDTLHQIRRMELDHPVIVLIKLTSLMQQWEKTHIHSSNTVLGFFSF